MGIIAIDKLTPGMKLSLPVKDRGGRIILAAGQELTEKHLKILRIWGITQAEVTGPVPQAPEAQETPKTDTDIQLEAEQIVQELFLHAGETHPAIQELRRLAVKRVAARMTQGGSHGN
jgi:hypothetical protein